MEEEMQDYEYCTATPWTGAKYCYGEIHIEPVEYVLFLFMGLVVLASIAMYLTGRAK